METLALVLEELTFGVFRFMESGGPVLWLIFAVGCSIRSSCR